MRQVLFLHCVLLNGWQAQSPLTEPVVVVDSRLDKILPRMALIEMVASGLLSSRRSRHSNPQSKPSWSGF